MSQMKPLPPFEVDVLLLAALIAAEARGESEEGQIAVACVVRNRVKSPRSWGRNWREVILKPKQFTPFNLPAGADAWEGRTALLNLLARVRPEHITIAAEVYDGDRDDVTDGATHFVNLALAQPVWAKELVVTVEIGQHTFLKERVV